MESCSVLGSTSHVCPTDHLFNRRVKIVENSNLDVVLSKTVTWETCRLWQRY